MSGSENAGGVLLLGVQGSGKTVFLSVIDHVFEEPAAFGLSLSGKENTPTSQYARDMYRLMRDGMEWPMATATQEFVELSWTVRSGVKPLFLMGSVDCAGESIVDALAPDYGRGTSLASAGSAGGGGWEDLGPRQGPGDIAGRLRERVASAESICLFVNPCDFERHIRDGGDDFGDGDDIRAALQRSDAMGRLLRKFLDGQTGEGKRIVIVLTQSGRENIRGDIEAEGGARAFLFNRAPFLEKLPRAHDARVVAVSAVNRVVWKNPAGAVVRVGEDRPSEGEVQGRSWTGKDGAGHFEPREFPYLRDDGDSYGLVEFLLAVGAPFSNELELLDNAIGELRESHGACARAWFSCEAVAELLRSRDDADGAWRVYKGLVEAFLSNPARRISDRAKRLTKLHLADERRTILPWLVAVSEVASALLEAAKAGRDISTGELCDEFRREIQRRVNSRVDEEAQRENLPLDAVRHMGIDEMPSHDRIRRWLDECRGSLSPGGAVDSGNGGGAKGTKKAGCWLVLLLFLLVVAIYLCIFNLAMEA